MIAYRAQAAAFLITLTFLFGLPSGLLIPPPQRAQASWPTIDIGNIVQSTLSAVYDALMYAVDIIMEVYQYLMYVKEWILEPIAYIQSGKALRGITGGMLSFVAGESNGTGRPQFVQNLPWHLRSVGDNTTSAFLRQLRANSDSPYAGVIADSLRSNYAEQTSLAGFFRANRNTLPQFSQNPTAFLSGNWSQGGMRAWFALTTQSQNNPYAMHRRAEQKLGLLLAQAENAVTKQLDWGDGLLSWCDDSEGPSEGGVCDAGGYTGTYTDGVCIQDEASDTPDIAQVPGAPCTKKDGTQGKIATPGSTIKGYFEHTLELDSQKLVQMGNAATQITSMIGGIMDTITLVQGIIGGPQGGLAGVTSAEGRGLLDRYSTTSPDYMGGSNCSINETLGGQSISNGDDVLTRIDQYKAFWGTIAGEASTTHQVLTDLVATCTTNLPRIPSGRRADAERVISQANAVLAPTGIVGSTLAYYNNLDATLQETVDIVEGLDEAMTEIDPATGDCKLYDPATVRDLTPSAQDLAKAEQDSLGGNISRMVEPWLKYFGEPKDPTDIEGLSFNVEGGSLVNKMTLLAETAEDQKIVQMCTP